MVFKHASSRIVAQRESCIFESSRKSTAAILALLICNCYKQWILKLVRLNEPELGIEKSGLVVLRASMCGQVFPAYFANYDFIESEELNAM